MGNKTYCFYSNQLQQYQAYLSPSSSSRSSAQTEQDISRPSPRAQILNVLDKNYLFSIEVFDSLSEVPLCIAQVYVGQAAQMESAGQAGVYDWERLSIAVQSCFIYTKLVKEVHFLRNITLPCAAPSMLFVQPIVQPRLILFKPHQTHLKVCTQQSICIFYFTFI